MMVIVLVHFVHTKCALHLHSTCVLVHFVHTKCALHLHSTCANCVIITLYVGLLSLTVTENKPGYEASQGTRLVSVGG